MGEYPTTIDSNRRKNRILKASLGLRMVDFTAPQPPGVGCCRRHGYPVNPSPVEVLRDVGVHPVEARRYPSSKERYLVGVRVDFVVGVGRVEMAKVEFSVGQMAKFFFQ